MSVEGIPTLEVDGSGIRVAIVAGSWHEEITNGLIAGAERTLTAIGSDYELIRVPGSFELPLVARTALENGFDAAVALGVIIRGGTPHFEFVSDAATSGLTRAALDAGKPVGFGVLTLDDEQQGLDRAGLPGSTEDKGEEAALAAVSAARLLRELRGR
ncbi:6,7-dimethyl-8-ribityllumazine synthase [Klugiella xanthotipulae]|uniref:6,7-dimethyl-8-ribityllumazine synthase n=1 Tax=Klugiella xanthotipulae TaxID=244735 RepID=A0A543HYP4_9MICO|nr:6,7-dimethyl-8-ribityllumazine synthase [Klugiella xanthotipulae]TQM63466.1 6,7-dimethyl-8-ribityllumazine synthase [Klugiella xanthotipulae]